jgi:diadenosine tetraphosphatase ApaH/serine/threonine PP2A family protein phosphatase
VVFRAGTDGMTLEQPPARATVALDARRALVNPGSVGQPRDGNPHSAYAILDDSGTAEFRRVPYDIERTQALMRKVDLPQRLVERLSWGR